ncbi:MAG: exopolyphosphatase / guanosine-5-triphosphate,3-diphosphate pyrophosphatase [Actinomycetota bacterium]|nr:exopolyphosphatase / guanosine-5-triphosphate,3-diphosphate pyrophosphatase [Actinomycetota bacterium]
MTRVAAVDMGTNSTRLLVSDGTEPLDRRMRITRLGQGVDATGRLGPDAIQRTVDVLREYRGVIENLGATSVRATATSAARDAANRDEFFAVAEDALGVRPELLPGDEEGRLSFLGATAGLDPADGPFLVVDIGGGSTEFIVGTDAVDGVVSTDMGCVRVTERFLHSDPPAPEELANAIGVVRDILDDVEREMPAVRQARRLVGLAGTITTMAAVEIGLPAYDQSRTHHFVLTHDAAEDVFRTLATEARAARIHNPGLEEARADVIVGGAIILVTIMRTWGIDECLVSESDILDGLVRSQL